MRCAVRNCISSSLTRQIRTAVVSPTTGTDDSRNLTMTDSRQQLSIESAVKNLPPTLDQHKHKGQAGRIGIIGGSIEYTGAPYFAAMTALRCGADLAYIFCMKDAANPIKSFAPELIVFPHLDDEHGYNLIVPRLANLHSLIIGPGLGGDVRIHSLVCDLIQAIKENERIRSSMSLVFDADAIDLLVNNKDILRDYGAPVYLTPNVNELRKLTNAYLGIGNLGTDDAHYTATLQKLASSVNEKATLIVKGRRDKIITGRRTYDCSIEGSSRRVGGQGDLLSGSLGLFAYWATLRRECSKPEGDDIPVELLAAYSACSIARLCNRFAYLQKGRSMITSDMILEVRNAYNECFN